MAHKMTLDARACSSRDNRTQLTALVHVPLTTCTMSVQTFYALSGGGFIAAFARESEPQEPADISPLGRKLAAIHKRIVASGAPLLSWDEIEREVADRRGGAEWPES